MDGDSPPEPGSSLDPFTRIQGGILAHPRLVLLAMVATFASVSFTASYVAYSDLGIINAHAYDLAIFQQALSSTAHGFHVPFYEASDCTAKARCSLLLVHPALVLYGLVPFYALAPSALTLFAARSIIVGAAAFPLYWLTRQVTESRAKALLAAGLYLVWAPTMSGDFYSFHVESFLPVELFTVMALWQAGRYRWGLLIASFSFVTLEVAPVFTFLIGVFFLVPALPPVFRAARNASRAAATNTSRLRGGPWALGGAVREQLRRTEVRASILLMAVSVVGFVSLALFMNRYGAGLLGVVSPSEPGGLAGLFFENSAGPVASSPSSFFTSPSLLFTTEYWLILFALLGFLPLLSWRAWVLTLPWMALTFLAADHRFSRIGSQYTMVALVPLFIGLAYGLAKLSWERSAVPVAVPAAVVDPTSPPEETLTATRDVPRVRRRSTWLSVLVFGVVVVNVVVNPLCPIIPGTTGGLPSPFSPGYFDNLTAIQPGIEWIDQMVALVPHQATIAVQNNLLPLVANDLASYRYHQYNQTQLKHLQFNVTDPWPEFVLVASAALNQPIGCLNVTQDWIPGCVSISNATEYTTDYGIRGYVDTTPIGEVILFELGYSGPSKLFGPATSPTYIVGAGLVPDVTGVVVANGSQSSNRVIGSNRSATKAGEFCRATVGPVASGNYTFRVALRLTPLVGASNKSIAVKISLVGILHTMLWVTTLTAAELGTSAWTVVDLSVAIVSTGYNIQQLQVAWQSLHYQLTVASLTWSPG